MSKKVIRYKNSQEWLSDRRNGIGASEVGTILGLNPFETPYQLWRRKKGLDAPKQENFAMKAGHYLEDAVSLFYRDATNCYVIKNTVEDFSIINPEKPFLRVSPDRLYWQDGAKHNEDNKCVLECKTTQMEIDENSIPQHWFCQLQMNMGVGEYSQGALAWLTMGRKFGFKDFMFDKEFYDWMIGEVEKYWIDYIVGDQEPLPVNVDDVLLKNPRHVAGKTVVATDELIEDCRQLKELKEELGGLDSRKKELEAAIKMAMGDAEALTMPNSTKPLATWKATKDKTCFDEKKFAAENPELYKSYQYTKAGTRMFLLK